MNNEAHLIEEMKRIWTKADDLLGSLSSGSSEASAVLSIRAIASAAIALESLS